MNTKTAYEILTEHGIKPSVQRMAIMEYLVKNPTHPTVDEIYSALIGSMPTLSKTTVNNTLRLFYESGAALMLTIDGRQVRFDASVGTHGHFLCKRCGRIYDIPCDRLAAELEERVLPPGFSRDNVELYYHGSCPKCNAKAQN